MFQRPYSTAKDHYSHTTGDSVQISSDNGASYDAYIAKIDAAENPLPSFSPRGGLNIESPQPHAKISPNREPVRSGSPGRRTFDIDSPEMREFISRGIRKRDGLPVTNLKLQFGTGEKKLIATVKKAAAANNTRERSLE